MSHGVGKRTQEQTRALGHEAKRRRRPRQRPALCPDAYAGEAAALLDALGHRDRAPRASQGGTIARPQLRWPPGWAYGQVQKPAQGRGSERVAVQVVPGKARRKQVLSLRGYKVIHPRVVECHHGTRRVRHQRKVRQTLAFSKAARSHRWLSGLAVGLDNVCHAQRSLKSQAEAQIVHRSPAMAAKLTDRIWSTWKW